MQPHYGFRAFKPKLELFQKLANRGCGSFLSSRKRWGEPRGEGRSRDAGEMGFAHSFPVGSWTSCPCSGQNSSEGVGSHPRGFEGKVVCHCATVSPVHTDFSTPTPRHTQIPLLPLLPSLSFNFSPFLAQAMVSVCTQHWTPPSHFMHEPNFRHSEVSHV